MPPATRVNEIVGNSSGTYAVKMAAEDQEKLRVYLVEAVVRWGHIAEARADIEYWKSHLLSGEVYVAADQIRLGWIERYEPKKG